MKKLSTSTIILLILLTLTFCFFLACSSSTNKEDAEDLKQDYWTVPTQYQNVPIEQIKSQVEITDYMTIKGAATNAGTESMSFQGSTSIVPGGGAVAEEGKKGKADRAALASYTNKTISLEGVVNTAGTQKTAPLEITEPEPGKYQIWFCNKTRKPCRYQAFLLYIGPPNKGKNLFSKENVIRFWGIIVGEELHKIWNTAGSPNYKRYPKIRVLDLEVIK